MIHAYSVVKAFFAGQDSIRTVSRLPASVEDFLPVRQILTVGGGLTGRALRSPRIAVHSFATSDPDSGGQSLEAARDLACSDYDLLTLKLPGSTYAGATVSRVDVISLPDEVPYGNPALFRFVAIYQLFMHDN